METIITTSANQKYDILEPDSKARPEPNQADVRYVRHCAQDAGTAQFNGLMRPLRQVTITGMTLTLDARDDYNLIRTYERQDDIVGLTIIADHLTISTPLHFPGTRVVIAARELSFEGDGSITTTPRKDDFRDPMDINGADGADGGDIVLLVSSFISDKPDGKAVKRFITTGTVGQNPDPGGFEPSETRRDLKTITEKEWDQVFSSSNRRLVHERGSAAGPDLYYGIFPHPSFSEYKRIYKNLTFIGLYNKTYNNVWHGDTSAEYHVASAGSKESPGEGGAAKKPGRPGVGGAGGAITANATMASSLCMTDGARSGTQMNRQVGARGGNPIQVQHLTFHGRPDGSKQRVSNKGKKVEGKRGPSGPTGDPAKQPKGDKGEITVLKEASDAWMVPNLLVVALQFARDCIAANRVDSAMASLKPYKAVVERAGATVDLESGLYDDLDLSADILGASSTYEQFASELAHLLEQAGGQYDEFGNPPGWVPGLSLSATVKLYRKVLQASMDEIYAAYRLEKAWNDKANKTKSIDDLIALLKTRVAKDQEVMMEARGKARPQTDELKQLLEEVKILDEALEKSKQELFDKADKEQADEDVKKAIAAGFKISGSILKSLPLPEPYQAAAGAFGAVLETTSAFVENGPNDAAFKELKSQVDGFDVSDDLVKSLSRDIESDLKANNKQMKAIDEKAQAFKDHNKMVMLEDERRQKLTEQLVEVSEKYGKIETAKLKAEKGTISEQDARAIEARLRSDASAEKIKEKKAELEVIDRRASSEKKKLKTSKKALKEEKKKREKEIKKRVADIKKITGGIEEIGKTINKLTVSRAEMNSRYDEILSGLFKTDDEYTSIMAQVFHLDDRKAKVVNDLAKTRTALSESSLSITRNLRLISELQAQKANAEGVMDPAALSFVQSMGQTAHEELRRFLYFVSKSYEYFMLKPWPRSYLDAQRIFDSLRQVMEPPQTEFDFEDNRAGEDTKAQREASLKQLLTKPGSAKSLSRADFELLKQVYEKPLRDMGRELAASLVKGSSRVTTGKKSITLGTMDLTELNSKISAGEMPIWPFDLLKLRQISAKRDRQRIVNVKVRQMRCKLPQGHPKLPDEISVKVVLDGPSIVRGDNRLYAFSPEGGEDAHSAGGGITFETTSQKTLKEDAWDVSGDVLTIKEAAFEQGDDAPLDTLLNLLLDGTDGDAVSAVSQFRPGLFSNLLLSVEFLPAGTALPIQEIVLDFTNETGQASVYDTMIHVRNNFDLDIPVFVSMVDDSGRSGGQGEYVGFFGKKHDLQARKLEVRVPETFGRYRHSGWLLDGKPTGKAGAELKLSASGYAVALFE